MRDSLLWGDDCILGCQVSEARSTVEIVICFCSNEEIGIEICIGEGGTGLCILEGEICSDVVTETWVFPTLTSEISPGI